MDNEQCYDFTELDLDHIENKGSSRRKYDITNVQLITRKAHDKKTNAKYYAGQRKDYRPSEFIEWINQLGGVIK